ncbi:MAG: hypothetical protein HOM21_11850, partial [Halobacteriovoraceae bacterium]|nr:hypothetical protein [Halobacteriovoraceae bacterium]
MKLAILLGATLLLFSLTSAAQPGRDSNNPAGNPGTESGRNEDLLGTMLDNPDVQKAKEKCEKSFPTIELGTCIWDSEKSGLSEDTKSALAELANQGESDNKQRLDGIDISLDEDSELAEKQEKEKRYDKSFRKLEEYLGEQLKEILFVKGDGKGKASTIAEDKMFFKLYKSQIGKNIISTLTSYCVEASATSTPPYMIKKDVTARNAVRQTNLKSLEKTVSKKDKDGNPTGEKVLAAKSNWDGCIVSLQHICYKTEKYITASSVSSGSSSPTTIVFEPERDADHEYSNQRACAVTNYLRESRQALNSTEKIEKKYETLADRKGTIAVSNVRQYGSEDADKKVDEILVRSSNELAQESGFKDEADAEVKKFEECFKDGQLQDAEACKEFLVSDGEDKKKIKEELAELTIRKNAVIERLAAKNLKNDAEGKEVLKGILEEQGYDFETELGVAGS